MDHRLKLSSVEIGFVSNGLAQLLARCAMLGFGILIIGIRRQILQHFCNWTWVASVTFIVELRNRNTAPDLNSKPSVINFLVFGSKP